MVLTPFPDEILEDNLELTDMYVSCLQDSPSGCDNPHFWFHLALIKNPWLVNGLLSGQKVGTTEETLGFFLRSLISLLTYIRLYLERETRITLNMDISNNMVPSGYIEDYIDETEDPDLMTALQLHLVHLKNGLYLLGGRKRFIYITDEGAVHNDWEAVDEKYLPLREIIDILGTLLYYSISTSGEPTSPVGEAIGHFEDAPYIPEGIASLDAMITPLLE